MGMFLGSRYYTKLGDMEKIFASFAIAPFIDSLVSEQQILPEDWNEQNLEHFCLVIIPNCSCSQVDFPTNQTKILEAFFLYLQENKVIKNGDVLAKKVRSIELEIIEAMKNSEFGKMARKIMTPMTINVDDFRDENGQIQRPQIFTF